MNDWLFGLEKVSMQHLAYSDNMVTGCNKQNFICHPFLRRALFRVQQCCISFLRLRAEFRFNGDIMSWPSKRPCLLQLSIISELNFGTDSDKARVSSNISSVEGGSESVPGLSQPQPYHQTASCHESSSSISSSASDKEDAGETGPGEQTQ